MVFCFHSAVGHNHDSSFSATVMGDDKKQKVSSSRDISKATTEANPFVDMLEGDGEAVPTQSYFDYPSGRGKSKTDETNSDDGDERDSSSVSGGNASGNTRVSNSTGSTGTNSKVSLRTDGERKPPSNSIPILNTAKTSRTGQRTRRPSSLAEVRSSSDETKTNDDNAIIDESRLQRTGGEEEQQELADVQRSIDGFPPVYPHDAGDANQAPSGSVSSIFLLFLFPNHFPTVFSLFISSHFPFKLSSRIIQVDIPQLYRFTQLFRHYLSL